MNNLSFPSKKIPFQRSPPKNQFPRFFVEEDRCYRSGVRTYRLNLFSHRRVPRNHRPGLRTYRANLFSHRQVPRNHRPGLRTRRSVPGTHRANLFSYRRVPRSHRPGLCTRRSVPGTYRANRFSHLHLVIVNRHNEFPASMGENHFSESA